jgi:hypothetical protein
VSPPSGVPRPRRRADAARVRQPRPNDIAFFRRSGKVSLRGIGLRSRVDRLDYADGEPD